MKKISLKTHIDKTCASNLLEKLPSNGTFSFSNSSGDFPLIRDILGLVFGDLPSENISPLFGYLTNSGLSDRYYVDTTIESFYPGTIQNITMSQGGIQITYLRHPDYYTYCIIAWEPQNHQGLDTVDFSISNRWVLEHIVNSEREIGLDISSINEDYYSYQILKRVSTSNLVSDDFKLGFSFQDYDDNNIVTEDTVFNAFSNIEFQFLPIYYVYGRFSYSLASEMSVDGTFSSSSNYGVISLSKPQTIVNTWDIQPAVYSLIVDYVPNYEFTFEPQAYLENLDFEQLVLDNLDILNECCSQMKNGDNEEMDLTPIVDILTSIDSRLHTLAEVDGVATDVNITQALIDNTESLEDIATRPIINTNEDLSPWSAV